MLISVNTATKMDKYEKDGKDQYLEKHALDKVCIIQLMMMTHEL